MTVSSTYSPPQAIGNGTTTSFGFPFQFFSKSDLVVNLFDTSANANVSPAPTLNGTGTYDYTVTGTQDPNTGEFLSGGNVVFNTAPLGNHRVTITRSVPYVQPISLINNGNFPAKTVEGQLDRLTMLLQQLLSQVSSQALIIPSSDPAGLILAARASSLRANNFLAWDASGNLIDTPGAAGGVTVSGAMVPVVQAASLAVARNLLNIPFSLFANPGATPYAVRAPQDIGTLFSSESMGGAGTFNLPSAATAGAGAVYGFVKRTNNLTLNHAGGDVIQGLAATFTTVTLVNDGDMLALQSDGTNWKIISATPGAWALLGAATQVTYEKSGSGTYTVPAGAVKLRIRMVGAGGGGGGSGTSGATAGGTGGNTTFSTFTAGGGLGGGVGTGAANGTGGAGGAAAGSPNLGVTGGAGSAALPITSGPGGFGAASPFGGGGAPGNPGSNAGGAAPVNSGSGGGGSSPNGATTDGGGGGGGGAYVEHWIIGALAASYAFAVGAAGTAGTGGASGAAGGAGGSGLIIVEAYFQ